MRMFEEQIIVSKHDLDELNHVNNITYIKWILGVAKKHWKKLVSNEIRNNYYWILLEHNIKYLHPAVINDKIRINTYIQNTQEVKSNRIVEIYNKETNKLLVTSETKWCLIDAKKNRPCRIPNEIRKAFT